MKYDVCDKFGQMFVIIIYIFLILINIILNYKVYL